MATKKNMSGALFINDKGDNDKRPDFRGDILINNVEYKLSAWRSPYAKGEYISIEASKKEEVGI